MGTYVATTPSNLGTLAAPAAVAASDTIPRANMGPNGAYLKIINGGGSPDTMTITDATPTIGGQNALPSGVITPPNVVNGTSKWFTIRAAQCDPATGVVTVTHSFITSVTYELIPF